MKKLIAAVVATALVTGCAGSTPNPVASSKMSDQYMDCQGIKAEQAHIDQQISKLVPQSKKGVKNTALAVTGWFLIVPWFFMDFSDAEKVEIKAYQERYLELEKLANNKKCGAPA
jgi:hypothetical protein